MFGYEADGSSFSVALFILQLFAVPPATLILGFAISLLIEGANAQPTVETLTGYFAFCVEGFALGYTVQRLLPRALTCGGPWVWIAPVSLPALGGIWDAVSFGPRDILLFFWLTSEGEGGWVFMLLTLPAVACCFYSLGIIAAHRCTR